MKTFLEATEYIDPPQTLHFPPPTVAFQQAACPFLPLHPDVMQNHLIIEPSDPPRSI